MEKDKIKQYISQFGGMLALLYLALQASGIEVEFLNRPCATVDKLLNGIHPVTDWSVWCV